MTTAVPKIITTKATPPRGLPSRLPASPEEDPLSRHRRYSEEVGLKTMMEEEVPEVSRDRGTVSVAGGRGRRFSIRPVLTPGHDSPIGAAGRYRRLGEFICLGPRSQCQCSRRAGCHATSLGSYQCAHCYLQMVVGSRCRCGRYWWRAQGYAITVGC